MRGGRARATSEEDLRVQELHRATVGTAEVRHSFDNPHDPLGDLPWHDGPLGHLAAFGHACAPELLAVGVVEEGGPHRALDPSAEVPHPVHCTSLGLMVFLEHPSAVLEKCRATLLDLVRCEALELLWGVEALDPGPEPARIGLEEQRVPKAGLRGRRAPAL